MARYILPMAMLCLLTARAVHAAAYFVDTRGDDTADGSRGAPWATIAHAVSQLRPGDHVNVRNGTYPPLVIAGLRGTAEAPIVIAASRNHLPAIDGLAQERGIVLDDCEHVVLRGFGVYGVSDGDQPRGIMLHNCRQVTLEGCVVRHCRDAGIKISQGGRNIVRGNMVSHCGVGIHVEGSDHNVIETNFCLFNNQPPGQSDGIAAATCRQNTYRGNVAIGNSGDGLDMGNSPANLLEQNIAISNGDGSDTGGLGLRLGSGWGPKNAQWRGGQNTVRGNVAAWNTLSGFNSDGSLDNTYEANVSYGNGQTGPYASVQETPPAEAEPIYAVIRARLAELIANNTLAWHSRSLPYGMGFVRELPLWPTEAMIAAQMAAPSAAATQPASAAAPGGVQP